MWTIVDALGSAVCESKWVRVGVCMRESVCPGCFSMRPLFLLSYPSSFFQSESRPHNQPELAYDQLDLIEAGRVAIAPKIKTVVSIRRVSFSSSTAHSHLLEICEFHPNKFKSILMTFPAKWRWGAIGVCLLLWKVDVLLLADVSAIKSRLLLLFAALSSRPGFCCRAAPAPKAAPLKGLRSFQPCQAHFLPNQDPDLMPPLPALSAPQSTLYSFRATRTSSWESYTSLETAIKSS